MRKSVVALNLGLYWNEQRERTKDRNLVLSLGARRRDVVLNRRVVVRRLRRVVALLQPAPRVAIDALLGVSCGDARERLRRRNRTVRDRAVRPDARLANRRRLRRYGEKQTGRQHGQHHEGFPFQR